jgi:glycosyltransferase involved in cell wall biosynthesis
VRSTRPAVLHAHDYKTNLLAVLLARRFGIPVMTTMHGYVSRGGRLDVYYRVDRWARRRMDRVVAVSEDLLEHAMRVGVPASRCALVENAIDVEQFARRETVAAAKQRLGLATERLLVGAVGRLTDEKGFDRLVGAFDRLLTGGCDAELVILGEGPRRRDLESVIARLGRNDRIRLVGHQTGVVDWYQAMDAFALSSLREGTPNVLLEAMALEVPVVATRIAGVPRMIDHGVNGLLVEPDDVEGLHGALRGLASDVSLRQRLAKMGRETIEARYTFSARMQKIRAIYDELLGGHCH